jgi:hypothetical protein
MKTKRNRLPKKSKSSKRKSSKSKSTKSKSWMTAVDAAQATLKKTGSLSQARMALRLQASKNARKLFGSITSGR